MITFCQKLTILQTLYIFRKPIPRHKTGGLLYHTHV